MREIILTPDGDIYDEVLMKDHADIAAVRFAFSSWPLPLGISRLQVYRFQTEPSDAELAAALESAKDVARVFWANEHGGAAPDGEVLLPIDAPGVVDHVAPAPAAVESPRSVQSDGRRGQLRAVRGDVHEDPRPYDGFAWALDEDLAGSDWKKGKLVSLPALSEINRGPSAPHLWLPGRLVWLAIGRSTPQPPRVQSSVMLASCPSSSMRRANATGSSRRRCP